MTGAERGDADITDLRRMTVASLWFIVLVGGFLQLLFGIDTVTGFREVALVAMTIVFTLIASAAVPLLTRSASAAHPLIAALAIPAVLTWALAVVPPFSGWSWGFSLALAGGMVSCLAPGRWKAAAVLGVDAAIGAVIPGNAHTGTDVFMIGNVVLFSLMPLSAVWTLRVGLRLERGRKIAAELAVARERLRFATDLHDIQGHNLQVIALKSELAERLLPDHPDRAARELAEIRGIARTALEDTRAVVNDYRTVTVAVEVRNAAAVLRSAGISCEATIDAPDMSDDIGTAFAVAIREAATNVLKHSKATVATIDLILATPAEYRLIVTNNAANTSTTRSGTGLAGLTTRVASHGGTVETLRDHDTFSLIVRIPAGAR